MNVAIRFADEVAEKRQPHGDKLSFYYADELIEFDRVAAKSPERKIKIKVLPDCSVKVAAPEDSSDDEVLRATKNGRVGFTSNCESFVSNSRTLRHAGMLAVKAITTWASNTY